MRILHEPAYVLRFEANAVLRRSYGPDHGHVGGTILENDKAGT